MPFDEAHVRALAERIAESSGLEVVDLEYHGGGKGRLLRIFIERNAAGRRALEQQLAEAAPGQELPSSAGRDQLAGITHEDCANFSRELGTILDVEDAVPGAGYLLEVSSPGLDRKLVKPADFERFLGSRVKLMTRDPIAGNRHFEGRLGLSTGERIQLALDAGKKGKHTRRQAERGEPDRTIEIQLSNIERARLVPEF